jgi:Fic family protein
MDAFNKKDLVELIKEDTQYLESFLVRSVHSSAAIEGNTVTESETQVLLVDGFVPVFSRPVSLREVNELQNLKAAWNYVLEVCKLDLSISVIHNIHKLVMTNIDGEAGAFKRTQNIVGSRLTTAPEKVPTEMQYLISNLMDGRLKYVESEEDLLEAVAWFHLEFEKVHPYPDGNGRTGRLLINWVLLHEGCAPVVINVATKAEYLDCLRNDDVKGLAKYLKDALEVERNLLNRNGEIV